MNFPYEAAAAQLPSLVNNYGGPLGLVGRLAGLGNEEIEAGVPWWAWFGIGMIAGGVVTYASREKIERILR